MADTIFLTPKKTGIAAYREQGGFFPSVVKVLTSPKTTLALGATLATLATAGALAPAATGAALRAAPAALGKGALKIGKAAVPKTAKGALTAAITIPTAVGILSSSKKAREKVKSALNPLENIERGKKVGEIIENPSKAADILGIEGGEKAGFIDYIKGAAKVGGTAALVAGGVVGAKALYEKYKQSKAEKAAATASEVALSKETGKYYALGATEPMPVGLGGTPVQLQSSGYATEAPQSTNGVKPIQNIIQIAVR